MSKDDDGGGEGSPPLRDSKKMTTTIFWGDDEGSVVMVWDGMTQEEQVLAKTVIREEMDGVIWRMKPTQSKLGEDTVGNRTNQVATVFLEEFGTRLEGVQPRGSKAQRRSENGSGGGFTRRKGWRSGSPGQVLLQRQTASRRCGNHVGETPQRTSVQ